MPISYLGEIIKTTLKCKNPFYKTSKKCRFFHTGFLYFPCTRSLVTRSADRGDPSPGADCVAQIIEFNIIVIIVSKENLRKPTVSRNLAHRSAMKGRVIIFSITGCPFCMRAKDKMQKLGIDYIDINLDNYPERRAEAKERSGRNTVPQIFFNNRHIGGFDDFDKLVREDFFPWFILSSLKKHS